MLLAEGDWVPLGNADEQKPAPEGSVEAWARSGTNPVGGWYGFKKGMRGRFGNYVPPVMERLGLAEVEHKPRGNRMRAVRERLRRRPPVAYRPSAGRRPVASGGGGRCGADHRVLGVGAGRRIEGGHHRSPA